MPGFTKIPFAFAAVSVAKDGVVTIDWPNLQDLDNPPSSYLLCDTPFDQGKTKKVHKVIYDGFPWVAKRFYDTGMGEGTVEIQENRLQLIKEACRLSTTQYFLEQFITAARQQDVDIEKVIEAGAGPSIASGFSLEQYEAVHEEDQSSIQEGVVVWLFEPRRNSKESTVLADIQSATAIKADGEGIEVLFDMMAHTLDGSSGVGDHGKSGIETFLQKHECGNRCRYLRLSCDGVCALIGQYR
ncbi:hypothetical protein B0H14DRAFT_2655600 [Mycena olivaceomarginata]|nr:hypothetical protein B0H14DRAFT_2655600 [Mycena olivaceomarginata]